MKLSTIMNNLTSQRLVNSVYRYMMFTRLSSLVATYPRLSRAELHAHRSQTAKSVVDNFTTTLTEFWDIYGKATQHGVEYDLTEELNRLVATPRRMVPQDQIKKLAEATGLPETTIEESLKAQRAKALGQALETHEALEQRIYEAEFTKADEELDPECPAEQVEAQAEKLVLWLATWSKPDWAELVLIKDDREKVAKWINREELSDEGEEPLGLRQVA